jgi:nucleoside-diphosphate-sugar epimerase
MHIILGAGGPVSNALTKELLQKGEKVRLVSRRPVTEFPGAGWMQADLKNGAAVRQVVDGASVIYLCAGLQYDKKVWAAEWPPVMQNFIDAGKATGARLIFFDNVYMYGPVDGAMTEDTPYRPASVKGEVRARIAEQLMSEARAGNVKASIARATDFYGSHSFNSFADSLVLVKYAGKKKASWLGDPSRKHSFTYVPDAGKALYTLGQHPGSDNQVWHVPSAPAITGKEFLEQAARAFGVPPKYGTINKFMLLMAGLFSKPIRESMELFYQYDRDYIFDSSKFETTFSTKPTSYEQGMQEFAKTLTVNR